MNSVMIRWTAPPGALVTGYIVRYRLASGNGGDGIMTVSQDSTNTETNGLTVGETYTFTVETTATNMLPGVSVGVSITVGEWHINYSPFISSLSLSLQGNQSLLGAWWLLQNHLQSQYLGEQWSMLTDILSLSLKFRELINRDYVLVDHILSL